MKTVSGKTIRQARKQQRISQLELAKGICTQATISSIENQDYCPNVLLIQEICYRLNLDLMDVISTYKYADKRFTKIEDCFKNDDYTEATYQFKRIKYANLEDSISKNRYNCYGGLIFLKNQEFNEAIYHFNMVLSQPDKFSANNIFKAISNIGIGYTYQSSQLTNNSNERSLKFINDSLELINKYVPNSQFEFEAIVMIYTTAAKYFVNSDPNRAIKIVKRTTDFLLSSDSIFYFDKLLKVQVAALNKQGHTETKSHFELIHLYWKTFISDEDISKSQAIKDHIDKFNK